MSARIPTAEPTGAPDRVVEGRASGSATVSVSVSSADAGALARLSSRLAAVRGPRDPVWRQLLLIGWLGWLYDMLSELAPTRRALAIAHGRGELAFERSIGVAPERALDHWLLGHHTLALGLSDYYDNAHFVVTLGLLGWLWWRRADIYVSLRNALVAINLIGFLVFLVYPVAPPRLLVGAGFADVVAATHAFGSWTSGSLASHADQYAAMPSLHIAWAAWCAVAFWRLSRRWYVRALGVLHVSLTGFVVLATGNHYLLDVVAGLATTALCFGIVAAVERRRRGGCDQAGAAPEPASPAG
ncbi:MAG: phosphatase PAP2 family protein [Solirubrobacteraceae bacterium]